MTMYSFGAASMLAMITLGTLAIDIKPHDKFLRENFEITDAKEIWGNDGWWVSCFFVDLDNDGFEEVISTTVSQTDRDGDASTFWTTKPDGKLHRLGEDRLLETNFFFNTFYYSHYRLDLGGRNKFIIGLDMESAGFYKDAGITMMTPTPDCIFGIDEGNQLSVVKLAPSLDDVFLANEASRVERIYPETFKGFDFHYVPQKTWFHGYRFPCPIGLIVPPERFNTFLFSFQKELQIRSGETHDVTVLAVLLDADNNGLTDCYLTSSVDRVAEDSYRWTLFMNENGELKKAVGTVSPDSRRKDLPVLEPVVVARKDAFCRVVRFDSAPSYIVLDAAKIRSGVVKKTITDRLTHSIEKLPTMKVESRDATPSGDNYTAVTNDWYCGNFSNVYELAQRRCMADSNDLVSAYIMLDWQTAFGTISDVSNAMTRVIMLSDSVTNQPFRTQYLRRRDACIAYRDEMLPLIKDSDVEAERYKSYLPNKPMLGSFMLNMLDESGLW